jgi:hypothetical protein
MTFQRFQSRCQTLALAALLACGPNARDRCFDEAEAEAQERVDRECPRLECADAPRYLDELERAFERCPP